LSAAALAPKVAAFPSCAPGTGTIHRVFALTALFGALGAAWMIYGAQAFNAQPPFQERLRICPKRLISRIRNYQQRAPKL
jgi:hypothetical protein